MNSFYVLIISVLFVADLCSCVRFHTDDDDVTGSVRFGAVSLCVQRDGNRTEKGMWCYRRKIPATDSVVVSMARWAAQQLNGKLVTVNSAEKQVVAGMMYYINFTMEEKSKKDLTCYVKVWWRAWLQSTKLVHHRCY